MKKKNMTTSLSFSRAHLFQLSLLHVPLFEGTATRAEETVVVNSKGGYGVVMWWVQG